MTAAAPTTLSAWLESAVPGGILDVRPLPGGSRNATLLIGTGDGERYALRRYPLADTCAVEVALLARVTGTVPVPEVVAADPDGSRAGEPVLLTRLVPGVRLDAALATGGPADAAALGRAAGGTLAAVGGIRFGRPGFFGADLVPAGPRPADGLDVFVERCLAEGASAAVLDPAERAALGGLARRWAPLLAPVAADARLVHADFNPKNLLVCPGPEGWAVAAVLDWEFAFSGSPLVDVGNMLRDATSMPGGYAEAFLTGFTGAGGDLPEGWPAISRALDLYALADFLTRPAGHPGAERAAALIRRRLAGG